MHSPGEKIQSGRNSCGLGSFNLFIAHGQHVKTSYRIRSQVKECIINIIQYQERKVLPHLINNLWKLKRLHTQT